LMGGIGVDAAANAARGGAGAAIATVRTGGRLATITSDPPGEQREITISSLYIRPDGRQLGAAAELAGAGRLRLEVGRTFPPDQAARALAAAAGGTGGRAVALAF
jgi:NADPH:quinone reductase-like Zn-dependent oxidoreductase